MRLYHKLKRVLDKKPLLVYFRGYIINVYMKIVSLSVIPCVARPMLLRLIGVKIGDKVWINHGVFFGSNKVVIGNDVSINFGTFLDGSDYIYIEDHVRLGPFVRILTASHTIQENVIRRLAGEKKTSPVTIGYGSWLNIGCTVYPGVIIARGCVIHGNAVVNKTTAKNGLYGGIPAKRLKDLIT